MKKYLKRWLMVIWGMMLLMALPFVRGKEDLHQVQATGTVEKFVIVLDPGHGGRDPGAVRSHSGVTYYERDIVLKIAQYCKEELEKLEGVEVHLTRYNNASTLMDRWERTQLALSLGADVIVSLHINSTGESISNVSGALVYCPYSDTESGRISQELAHTILKHLEGPGLKNRGLLIDEELGMIRYPKASNVPGVLVEHGFINNPNDVHNYLSTDQKLKELGIADAQGIIEYFSLTDMKKAAKLESVEIKKVNGEKGTFRLKINGLKAEEGIKEVKVMVWNQSDKNDRYTYKAKLQKDGSYLVKGNIKNHKYHYGTYQYQISAINKKEIVTHFAPQTFEMPVPELNFKVKSNKNETKYTISSDHLQGTSGMRIAVWSEKGGQDDLKWYKARKNRSGRWVKSINISDYQDVGVYYADFYVVYPSGVEQCVGRSTFQVSELTLKELKVNKLNYKEGTFYLYIKGIETPAGVKNVTVTAWTQKDKSDLYTYKAKRITKKLYRVKIAIKNHQKQYGIYNIQASVKDKRGFFIESQKQQEFPKPQEETSKENPENTEEKVENTLENPEKAEEKAENIVENPTENPEKAEEKVENTVENLQNPTENSERAEEKVENTVENPQNPTENPEKIEEKVENSTENPPEQLEN